MKIRREWKEEANENRNRVERRRDWEKENGKKMIERKRKKKCMKRRKEWKWEVEKDWKGETNRWRNGRCNLDKQLNPWKFYRIHA